MRAESWLPFFLRLQLALLASAPPDDEYPAISSTAVGEVCELDNSCNSSTSSPLEGQVERSANLSQRWKYNVSDGSTSNDSSSSSSSSSTIDVYRVSETNNSISLELDESSARQNESESKNDTKSSNTKFQIRFEEHCFCDLHKGSCDLNCCCDKDCLYINRDIFQECNESRKSAENSLCPTKILNSPFLCVVRDNLYSRHFYPKQQVSFETVTVEKLLKNRNVFNWPFPSLPNDTTNDFEQLKKLKVYEIGSPVWILTNDSKLEEFRFPKSTLVSRDCENTEPVYFLENQETVCTYRVKDTLKSECEDKNSIFNSVRYYANFSFIINPNSTNLSLPLDCSRNCASIKPFICEGSHFDRCAPFNQTQKPFWDKSVCRRAVADVHYKLIHNGTEGIQSVELYLQLDTVQLAPGLLWSVSFRLTHQWVNQATHFELSGYPGYIFGKPVIIGHAVFKKRAQNSTENSMEMSHNKGHWFTYFGTDMEGCCLRMRRNNILFGENIYAHCFVPVPKIRTIEQCETFQNEIYSIMFGEHINISNVYASTLGYPDIVNTEKWTPFVLDLAVSIANESCSGIVSSVKILVLHALVGEHDDPQQSIVGVKVAGNKFYRGGQRRDKLKISISVNFHDVTNPPLRIFAEPPTYEVKLPTDFFYPFFSKCSKLVESTYLVIGLPPLIWGLSQLW